MTKEIIPIIKLEPSDPAYNKRDNDERKCILGREEVELTVATRLIQPAEEIQPQKNEIKGAYLVGLRM